MVEHYLDFRSGSPSLYDRRAVRMVEHYVDFRSRSPSLHDTSGSYG
jgi:hypothetical protein